MGPVVRLIPGIWNKSGSGVWTFDPDPGEVSYGVAVEENQSFSSLINLVRARYGVHPQTTVALTYQFPEWMSLPNDITTPPVDIRDTSDVQLFMALRLDCPLMAIYVTLGAYAVDRYRFHKSSCYSAGEGSTGEWGAQQPSVMDTPFHYLGNTSRNSHAPEYGDSILGDPAAGNIFWEELMSQGLEPISEESLRNVFAETELSLIINDSTTPTDSETRNIQQRRFRADTQLTLGFGDQTTNQHSPLNPDWGDLHVNTTTNISAPTNEQITETENVQHSSNPDTCPLDWFGTAAAQFVDLTSTTEDGQASNQSREQITNSAPAGNVDHVGLADSPVVRQTNESTYRTNMWNSGEEMDGVRKVTDWLSQHPSTVRDIPVTLVGSNSSAAAPQIDGLPRGWFPCSEKVLLEICTEKEMAFLREAARVVTDALPPGNPWIQISDDDKTSNNSSGVPNMMGDATQTEGIVRLGEGEDDTIHYEGTKVPPARDVHPPPVSYKGKEKIGEGSSEKPASGRTTKPNLGLSIGCRPELDGEPANDPGPDDDSSDTPHIQSTRKGGTYDIFVGQIFIDRSTFKHHMAMYAIANKFHFRCKRSEPEKMVLECSGGDCKWRVYAARVKGANWYELRRANLQHRCNVTERGAFMKHASSKLIAAIVRSKYERRGRGPTPGVLRDIMRDDHNVPITYWKAWRSRESALNLSKGAAGDSYRLLPSYLQQLVIANPGTIVHLETSFEIGVGQRFKYLFFSIGACISGFPSMRKVIVLDGTHLKGKYGGCLLTASFQDGNYQIFPIGFGIVDGENDGSWGWFLEKLSAIVEDNHELVFVTDRHGSIYSAIKKVYPRARHGVCVVHLQRNIQTIFKKRNIGYLVSKAARAFTMPEFYEQFNELKRVDAVCADYLTKLGFAQWTRSHFCGARYNVMTSNIAESLNAALAMAREFPIIPLVEYIRSTLMTWFAIRREGARKSPGPLTRRIQHLLEKNFVKSTEFHVANIRATEFEVRTKDGDAFRVDLENRYCSCREFQMLEFPCAHAVAGAVACNANVEALAATEYLKETWCMAYEGSINPVPVTEGIVEASDDLANLNLFPPSTRRPPGRPRKKRFLSRGEFKASSRKKATKCSRCGGAGHNRATCKRPI